MSILIAIPKGRLGDELIERLAGTDLAMDPAALKGRGLRVPTAMRGVEALLLKGADLPRYVAEGVAALGVVGSDTLDEQPVEVLELADLGFGACRLALCARAGTELHGLLARPHLRLATKYLRATEAWLARQGLTAELVPLTSSVELAPLVGLADAIVDLVQSGSTLKANDLVELATLGSTSARLIAARGAYLARPAELRPVIEALRRAAG
ncbi:MAG: ATP phosphoribosyltransferase [Deltaproteobacteria bacterium]|nr:ATP phosphoribosyltransferase [Deltaproteobacteria bacterium]